MADLVAFAGGDKTEWLSNGRSFDYGGKIAFSTGDTLYSNKSRPMLSIVDDSVGRHDFLFTACSAEMYRIQYDLDGDVANCLDNLTAALASLGVESHEIPTPFNLFMNVSVDDDGSLRIEPPLTQPGDAVVLRAEMDLEVALSACPAGLCNGGSQKPIGWEILSS